MPNWIKLFTLHFFILPFIPYNNTTKIILALFFSILFLFLGVMIHKVKFYSDYPSLLLILRLILILASFLCLIAFLNNQVISKIINKLVSEQLIAYLLIILIITSFILIMGDFLIRLVNNITNPREVQGKLNKIEAYTTLFGALLAPFLLPNLFFGFSYSLVLTSLHSIELSYFQSYYLSFVINYALPISNEKILDIIKIINTDTLLRTVQIAHITITKIIDLTIIAIVIKYISNLIRTKNPED
jgi:hypothetical protein